MSSSDKTEASLRAKTGTIVFNRRLSRDHFREDWVRKSSALAGNRGREGRHTQLFHLEGRRSNVCDPNEASLDGPEGRSKLERFGHKVCWEKAGTARMCGPRVEMHSRFDSSRYPLRIRPCRSCSPGRPERQLRVDRTLAHAGTTYLKKA